MAPPPGRLGGTVKLPVQVRMFPEEIAAVDAFAAALSQQSYGAAFSRAEALRIAAMEWLKERQARRALQSSGADPGGPHGRGDAGAPACRGAPGRRPPPGDGRQYAAWPGAAGAGPHSARPLCGDGAGARGGALRRRAGLGQGPGRLCSTIIPRSYWIPGSYAPMLSEK